jgi:PAS domain S-box-containing protein
MLDLYGSEHVEETYARNPLDFIAPDYHQRFQANVRKTLKEGITRDIEYVFVKKDGTHFPGETSAAVIRDAAGEPKALMALVRDITKRKQAQEALEKEQDSLRRMLQASDRERELITYEIHDGVAQRLLGALMQFEAYPKADREVPEEAKARFDAGLAGLRLASDEARSLMNRTRTPVLQKFGLKAAIADFIDQFSDKPNAPEITYRCEAQFKRLEPVLENTLFRVAQEAITNACVHSKSEIIRVALIQDGDDVTVEVEDNGIGFDTASVTEGRFGLDGIRERTRLLGKALEIESTPGQGTRIRATFPLLDKGDGGGSGENNAG